MAGGTIDKPIHEEVMYIYENSIKYGICFCKKNCRVKCATQTVEIGWG
jgi:hypothetical protein